MILDNWKVYNFVPALRGMRNPMDSWDRSDTSQTLSLTKGENVLDTVEIDQVTYYENLVIGPNDMRLALQLIKAGGEHRKFLRQIFLTVDITAPLYWWKEFDTYKVGTVSNSTSTMHKITSKPITLDCFEIDDYNPESAGPEFIASMINHLEQLRLKFLETKDKTYWKELIRWLPAGWLQTRTVTMNYENLLSMIAQRRNHKLTEWSGKDTESFMTFVEKLPMSKEFLMLDKQ